MADSETAPKKGMNPLISVLLLDIGLAIGAYYGCRALGLNEYLSLLAATLTAGLRIAYVAIRQRTFDAVSGVMCVIFGLGLAVSFATGDEKFLLAMKSVTTVGLALIFFGTCVLGRPAAFYVALRFGAEDEPTRKRWSELYSAVPAFRRTYLVMTLTWGLMLLIESVARIVVIYLLPTDVAVGVSSVMLPATIALITMWSAWYGKRSEHRVEQAKAALGVVAQPAN